MNVKRLALKYHHDPRAIAVWLRWCGLLRRPKSQRVMQVHPRGRTPMVYELAAWLVRATELGYPPNGAQIDRIMSEIRMESGGQSNKLTGKEASSVCPG
jgi:hypothetical protein